MRLSIVIDTNDYTLPLTHTITITLSIIITRTLYTLTQIHTVHIFLTMVKSFTILLWFWSLSAFKIRISRRAWKKERNVSTGWHSTFQHHPRVAWQGTRKNRIQNLSSTSICICQNNATMVDKIVIKTNQIYQTEHNYRYCYQLRTYYYHSSKCRYWGAICL